MFSFHTHVTLLFSTFNIILPPLNSSYYSSSPCCNRSRLFSTINKYMICIQHYFQMYKSKSPRSNFISIHTIVIKFKEHVLCNILPELPPFVLFLLFSFRRSFIQYCRSQRWIIRGLTFLCLSFPTHEFFQYVKCNMTIFPFKECWLIVFQLLSFFHYFILFCRIAGNNFTNNSISCWILPTNNKVQDWTFEIVN